MKGNNYKVKQCLPNARVIFKEAIKDSCGGRPKNGMFVAISLDIKELVLDVSPTHWRVQAIILSTPSNKLLIINSYFPTNHWVNEFDTTDLFSILSAINSVLMENEYDSVIASGVREYLAMSLMQMSCIYRITHPTTALYTTLLT